MWGDAQLQPISRPRVQTQIPPCSLCVMHMHCALSEPLTTKIKTKSVEIWSFGLSHFIICACFYGTVIPISRTFLVCFIWKKSVVVYLLFSCFVKLKSSLTRILKAKQIYKSFIFPLISVRVLTACYGDHP